jgi:hypothetical protein
MVDSPRLSDGLCVWASLIRSLLFFFSFEAAPRNANHPSHPLNLAGLATRNQKTAAKKRIAF